MGLFSRFKKNNDENSKQNKNKEIHEDSDVDESQLMLKEIALNSKDRYERAAAADKITDQYVALDLAKSVKDRAIRLIAINNVKDERLLLVKNSINITNIFINKIK